MIDSADTRTIDQAITAPLTTHQPNGPNCRGVCGRRMQGSWNRNQPYYRCKFPAEYAVNEVSHSRIVGGRR